MTLEILSEPETYLSLLTLTAMEIVLGIDNIVFISILTGKLPLEQQPRARTIGLSLALVFRLGLLFAISWVMGLTAPLFSLLGKAISGRDVILLGGGLFLVAKATHEIHDKLEGLPAADRKGASSAAFGLILAQILALDVVFSLDSVITAVGMANDISVMVTAVVLAVAIMLLSAEAISGFVQRHPTVKMLALSFLLLIGLALIGDGLEMHIPKGYIYFAMGFSMFVETINMRVRGTGDPVALHRPVRP
jgi:predicted tellurium resistance membrane protein TerC